MITKEQNVNKYCCLYVSDFHLEMILLPFIKKQMQNSKVLIFTQKNLYDSIKVLLEKTNLSMDNKKRILKIKNWNNNTINEINNDDINEHTIIINGDERYINTINNEIKKMKINVKNIVDCYDINNSMIESNYIEKNYKGVLNTESI